MCVYKNEHRRSVTFLIRIQKYRIQNPKILKWKSETDSDPEPESDPESESESEYKSEHWSESNVNRNPKPKPNPKPFEFESETESEPELGSKNFSHPIRKILCLQKRILKYVLFCKHSITLCGFLANSLRQPPAKTRNSLTFWSLLSPYNENHC